MAKMRSKVWRALALGACALLGLGLVMPGQTETILPAQSYQIKFESGSQVVGIGACSSAVAVVVLNGGNLADEATGGQVAAPVARAVIEAALGNTQT